MAAPTTERRPQLRLGELLVELGFLTRPQLEAALLEQKSSGARLGKILVAQGTITEGRLVRALSQQLGINICDPLATPIHQRVVALVSRELAYRFRVMPIGLKRNQQGDQLLIATADPLNRDLIPELEQGTGRSIVLLIAGETEIDLALARYYLQQPPDMLRRSQPPAANVPIVAGQPVSQPASAPANPPLLSPLDLVALPPDEPLSLERHQDVADPSSMDLAAALGDGPDPSRGRLADAILDGPLPDLSRPSQAPEEVEPLDLVSLPPDAIELTSSPNTDEGADEVLELASIPPPKKKGTALVPDAILAAMGPPLAGLDEDDSGEELELAFTPKKKVIQPAKISLAPSQDLAPSGGDLPTPDRSGPPSLIPVPAEVSSASASPPVIPFPTLASATFELPEATGSLLEDADPSRRSQSLPSPPRNRPQSLPVSGTGRRSSTPALPPIRAPERSSGAPGTRGGLTSSRDLPLQAKAPNQEDDYAQDSGDLDPTVHRVSDLPPVGSPEDYVTERPTRAEAAILQRELRASLAASLGNRMSELPRAASNVGHAEPMDARQMLIDFVLTGESDPELTLWMTRFALVLLLEPGLLDDRRLANALARVGPPPAAE